MSSRTLFGVRRGLSREDGWQIEQTFAEALPLVHHDGPRLKVPEEFV
jgi:hypothetical protein